MKVSTYFLRQSLRVARGPGAVKKGGGRARGNRSNLTNPGKPRTWKRGGETPSRETLNKFI